MQEQDAESPCVEVLCLRMVWTNARYIMRSTGSKEERWGRDHVQLDMIFAVVIVVVIRNGRHLFISVVIAVGRRSGETLHHVCLKIFEED